MISLTNVWRSISSLQCYLVILIGLSAVTGDFLVNHTKRHIYRALCDNFTHAIVGGLAWLLVCLNHRDRNTTNTLIEIITCTMTSSLIDLDHFYLARSFSLKDATSLKYRPPLHCTTIPLVVSPMVLFLSYLFNVHSLQRYTLILFTAFITHHTRDATRRGYWLYPFGSTPAIPYIGYVLITILIPYFVYGIFCLGKFKKSEPSNFDI